MAALEIIGIIALLFLLPALLLMALEAIERRLTTLGVLSRHPSSWKQLHALAALGFAIGCWLSYIDVPFKTTGLGFIAPPLIIVVSVYLAPIVAGLIMYPVAPFEFVQVFIDWLKRRRS